MRRLSFAAIALANFTVFATPVAVHLVPIAGARFDGCTIVASKGAEALARPASSTVSLDLSAGQWNVSLRGDGCWAQETLLAVPFSSVLDLDVYKRAAIAGVVRVEEGDELPKTVGARLFSTSDSREIARAQCPVDRDRFVCSVPAGEFDIQLRATAHISHFFLKRAIVADRATEVGTLLLRKGASIVGRVQPSSRSLPLDHAIVMAQPMPEASRAVAMTAATILSASVDDRGFFHVAGIAPGQYRLSAHQKGLISTSTIVKVVNDMQAELESPILLSRPQALVVLISPPQSPDGKPWRVALSEYDNSRHTEDVSSTASDVTGRAEFPALRPANYRVSVGPETGGVWVNRDLDLGSAPASLSIDLPSARVRGVIRWGERLLESKLTFGGRNGVLKIETTSNALGEFEAILPSSSENHWTVNIESKVPRISRDVRVSVPETPDERNALRIDIPGTTMQGKVVDETGAGRAAIVSVVATDGAMVQVPTEKSGDFEVAGLDAGKYRVQAESSWFDSKGAHLAYSAPSAIALDDLLDNVSITVRERVDLRGRVTSPYGVVPYASVWALPTDTESLISVRHTTATDGTFTIALPPNTHEVDFGVAAAGLGIRFFHATVSSAPMNVELNHSVGALRLLLPADRSEWSQYRIVHAGAALPIMAVFPFGASDWSQDHVSVLFDAMEVGTYRLCRTNGPACAGKDVLTGATATLEIPAKSENAGGAP